MKRLFFIFFLLSASPTFASTVLDETGRQIKEASPELFCIDGHVYMSPNSGGFFLIFNDEDKPMRCGKGLKNQHPALENLRSSPY